MYLFTIIFCIFSNAAGPLKWTSVDIVGGISWAKTNKMHVASMSLGGLQFDQTGKDAVADFYDSAGGILCAAMGNDGNAVKNYPAAYPDVVAVAAIDDSDTVADFSCFGSWCTFSAPV